MRLHFFEICYLVLLSALATLALLILASPGPQGWSASMEAIGGGARYRGWIPSWALGTCWIDSLLASLPLLRLLSIERRPERGVDIERLCVGTDVMSALSTALLGRRISAMSGLLVVFLGMCASGLLVLLVQLGLSRLWMLATVHFLWFSTLLAMASLLMRRLNADRDDFEEFRN